MNEKLIDYLISREGTVAAFGLGALVLLVPMASLLLPEMEGIGSTPKKDTFVELMSSDLSLAIILALLASCAPALGMVIKQLGARLILWLYRMLFGKREVGDPNEDGLQDYASLVFHDKDAARLYAASVATTTGGLGLALFTGSLVTYAVSCSLGSVVGLSLIPLFAGGIGFGLIVIALLLVRPALDWIRTA